MAVPGDYRGSSASNKIWRRGQGKKMKHRFTCRETVQKRCRGNSRLGAMVALIALAIIAAPGDVLHAQGRTARAKADEAGPPKIDPVMELAFSRARASLDQFLDLARLPPPHLRGFALKVSITEEPDVVEYFWINDFTQNGDSFSGKINNRPVLVKRVRSGRIHQFQRSDIVDWTYIDTQTRTVHGNFTACALLAKKPADLAAELRQKFGLICDI